MKQGRLASVAVVAVAFFFFSSAKILPEESGIRKIQTTCFSGSLRKSRSQTPSRSMRGPHARFLSILSHENGNLRFQKNPAIINMSHRLRRADPRKRKPIGLGLGPNEGAPPPLGRRRTRILMASSQGKEQQLT